ncbi:MAG: glycine cleavage system aminomethyltransferase GcvT [Woeseiaceae bacterium]|nr:glycine cleavage system aminomethyltransferase GcvT [Woeseiaceae bacterium]
MAQRTPLYPQHEALGARIVDFGGWDMPLHYGSQVDEHHAVRQDAGVFDVSHMTVVDVTGAGAKPLLQTLLANDVGRLQDPGKALYSCMLNEAGGIVDDLIVYRIEDHRYRVVLNAATREKDLRWIESQRKGFDADIDVRDDLAMIAVQGPRARQQAAALLPEAIRDDSLALKPFYAVADSEVFVARTGYTGEDGFEIILPADRAAGLWAELVAAGVRPAGLGARDTLRLEAGMHLYGTDMDDSLTPLESGLGWTVAWDPADRDFIGRHALEAQRERKDLRRFAGLLLVDRGVLRNHQRVVIEGRPDGEITSGGYSPTLGRSIAMARLPAGDEREAKVEVRNRLLEVRIVSLPFVRHGKPRVEL